MSNVQPQFPIFIPTLSRYDSRMTIKALQRMSIERWYAVVEPQEYDQYAAVVPKKHILVLDMSYKDRYETLDDLGLTKSVGPGAARNFIWDKSIEMGYPWHWVMDDNIYTFYRANGNLRHDVLSGAFFRAMEQFCLRYENVAMAGPNYDMFVPRKYKTLPLIFNTRIYSCNLIRNDVPFRWRGRYNEDTILSLDMLTAGWCTVEFNAFLQKKIGTQRVKGGNNKVFYSIEGTRPKSQMLVDVYPEYTTMVHKFNRIHHYVDYRSFRKNKLIRKPDVVISDGDNECGMELQRVKNGRT
jgi:hypothetical protein